MTDWRLQGHEKYLQGAVLERKAYPPYRPEWEHDHCEFCSAEFSLDTPVRCARAIPRLTTIVGSALSVTKTFKKCWACAGGEVSSAAYPS